MSPLKRCMSYHEAAITGSTFSSLPSLTPTNPVEKPAPKPAMVNSREGGLEPVTGEEQEVPLPLWRRAEEASSGEAF